MLFRQCGSDLHQEVSPFIAALFERILGGRHALALRFASASTIRLHRGYFVVLELIACVHLG